MTEIDLAGLPLDRRRFLQNGTTAWNRRNTDPNAQGVARRRGTQRLTDAATAANVRRPRSLGLSAHSGVTSYAILDDSQMATVQTVFAKVGAGTGPNFAVNCHIIIGSLASDHTAILDFPLFSWNAVGTSVGTVEIGVRTEATNLRIYAYLNYGGGTLTLTNTFTVADTDPTDAFMVTLSASGDTITLKVTDDAGATTTASGTLAATSRTILSGIWTDITLLGRALRGATTTGNATPKGARPTITDLSIWAQAVTVGTEVKHNQRLDVSTIPTGLVFLATLNDGALRESAATYYTGAGAVLGTGRLSLVPGPPVVDGDKENGGVIFSGEGGHGRVPYSPSFDAFFTKRGQAPAPQPWMFQALVIRTGTFRYLNATGTGDGDAQIVQWGSKGALILELKINKVGGNNVFSARIGNATGTPLTLNHGLNLTSSGDARWLVTVAWYPNTTAHTGTGFIEVTGDVSGIGTPVTGSVATEYGPEFDEAFPPEVYIGAAYDPATDTWSNPYRGRIKRALLLRSAFSLSSNSSGAKDVDSSNALWYFRFRRTLGELCPDESPNGSDCLFESDPRAGSEAAPVFWKQGPIQDGGAQACLNGVLLTSSGAIVPSGTDLTEQTEHGYLYRGLSTDAVGVRTTGGLQYVVSQGRVHLLKEAERRMRPVGLPRPQVRPGTLAMGPGPLHGVTCYAYTYMDGLGRESPAKILEPFVIRNGTAGVGGGEGQPGAIYGDGGGTGYFALADAFAANVYDNTPDGTYTFEALARMDTTLKISDLREQVFDRGILGGASNGVFWGIEPGAGNDDIKADEPFTLQVAFRFVTIPAAATDETVVASIGAGGNLTGAQDPAQPIVLTLDRVDATNAKLRLYVAAGPQITNGWANTIFTTQVQVATDYNIVLRFDGQNYSLFVNGTKDATTATSGPPVKNPNNLDRLAFGGAYSEAEPAFLAGQTYVKFNATGRWYLGRFWQRAIPDSDIGALSNVWFDAVQDARMVADLRRFYRFSSDSPFNSGVNYWNQTTLGTTAEYVHFNRNQRNGSGSPLRPAQLTEVWNVDAYSGRIVTFLTSTPTTQFASPFQWLWSRIGNGSLIATSGSNLCYYAANERLEPLTPVLPIDPQGWGWYTMIWASDDGIAQPTMSVQSLWVNGVRVFSGGTSVNRDVTGAPYTAVSADLAGWRNAPAGSFEVHLAEFRGWNSAKYVQSDDFEWLTRRVPASLWSTLVYYYQMATLTGGDVRNDGTADATVEHLDVISPAALVTVSSTAIAMPPWPDITSVRFYRSRVLPVIDWNDNDELDRLRRIAVAGPFYFIGAVAPGVSLFQDGTPNELLSLGVPLRQAAGLPPLYVTGVFSWGGLPVYFGNIFNPLRLYVADPLDHETFEPGAMIDVPSQDMDKVTAAVTAGEATWIFGPGGGVVYYGGPGQSQPIAVGGGIGAETSRCIAAYGSTVFVFGKGGLWAISPGGERGEIGRQVIDLLPSDATLARLQVVGDSLYLIDESDGDTLRFHLPLRTWDFLSGASLRGGTKAGSSTYFAHRSGFFSLGDQAIPADDARSGQTLSGTVAAGSTASTLVSTGTPFPAATAGTDDGCRGQWVRLIRAADGSTEYHEILSNTTSVLTLTDTWAGATPVSTDVWAIGAFETLVDSGWIVVEGTGLAESMDLSRISGEWRMGYTADDETGDPATDLSATVYATFSASDRYGVDGDSGKYIRFSIRSLMPAAAAASGCLVKLQAIPMGGQTSA